MGIPILLVLNFILDSSWEITASQFILLSLSGIIGILIGDSMLFKSLQILGPIRSYLIFSLNAPAEAIAGFLLFDDKMSMWIILGCFLCLTGAITSNLFSKKQGGKTDKLNGSIRTGLFFGLAVALCQVSALFLLKFTMDSNADPMVATLIRVSTAAILINLPSVLTGKFLFSLKDFTKKDKVNIFIASLFGIGFGLLALSVGIGSTLTGTAAFLTSLSPVFI